MNSRWSPSAAFAGTSRDTITVVRSIGPTEIDGGSTLTLESVAWVVKVRDGRPQLVTVSRTTAVLPGQTRLVTSPIGCGAQHGAGISQPHDGDGRDGSRTRPTMSVPTLAPCPTRSPTDLMTSASVEPWPLLILHPPPHTRLDNVDPDRESKALGLPRTGVPLAGNEVRRQPNGQPDCARFAGLEPATAIRNRHPQGRRLRGQVVDESIETTLSIRLGERQCAPEGSSKRTAREQSDRRSPGHVACHIADICQDDIGRRMAARLAGNPDRARKSADLGTRIHLGEHRDDLIANLDLTLVATWACRGRELQPQGHRSIQ